MFYRKELSRTTAVVYMSILHLFLWVGMVPALSSAFSISNLMPKVSQVPKEDMATRRNFIQVALTPILLGQTTSAFLISSTSEEWQVANAAMQSNQEVFKVGKDLSPEQAKQRVKDAIASLEYLLNNYDQICEGGGDNIRRYLGTVGTTSGVYGIIKTMKILQNEADDIVEFTETMNEVNTSINQADGSAYMAIFTTSSTSGVPPKKYFDDAKTETKNAIKALNDLAKQLDI